MKPGLLLALLLTAALPSARAAESAGTPPSAPLTLEAVFAAIRANHPSLAAAAASTEAASARIDQEKAWADPRLAIDLKRGDTALNTDTTNLAKINEIEVTVSQEIPLSGRPALRAEAARAEAGVTSAQSRRREWMLLNQARLAFTRLASLDERLALNTRLHINLAQTRALARQAYESGRQSQSELLSLETELARLDTERAEISGLRLQESSQLNAIMIRPVETGIALLTLPAPSLPALSLPDAVSRARTMSPDITIAFKELAAAQARLAVARKNRAIDPELSITARQMRNSGEAVGSFDTGIAFSLPWFNDARNRAEQSEARSRVNAARFEAASVEAEIAGMVASAHARASTGFDLLTRYETELLPLARASTAAALRAYETGRASLPSVLVAERLTLETEQKFTALRAEQALASAELCFLTSQDIQP